MISTLSPTRQIKYLFKLPNCYFSFTTHAIFILLISFSIMDRLLNVIAFDNAAILRNRYSTVVLKLLRYAALLTNKINIVGITFFFHKMSGAFQYIFYRDISSITRITEVDTKRTRLIIIFILRNFTRKFK